MKKILIVTLGIVLFRTGFAQTSITDSVNLKYVSSIEISTTDFNKLLPLITKPGKSDQEKLTLVYLWVYSHITFDTERFLKTGPLQPLSLSQTLKSGKAMCYEYNEFTDAASKYLKIPGYNIEGYVKYYGFEPGLPFTQNNHIWYAAYIDGAWKMIDLLWACGTLAIKDDSYQFRKNLHKEFFLVDPANFTDTHLPADPVWQFKNRPQKILGFTSKTEVIDSNQFNAYINFADSIKVMNQLNPHDKELRSAIRAYNFNTDNPNQLTVIYYNDAVELVNDRKATKVDLIRAKNYFIKSKLLITKSKDPDMKALAPVCEKGIKSIENHEKE
jgi:transglutaminase/protease-like cytokinesis protein 3